LGVLDVQNNTVGTLDEEDQIMLMGLCGQIAVAINNHRLDAKRREAEEAQQKLVEELDAFAHTVGHNLRDTLALIIGYADLLKEQARLPEELQEFLNAIARNGRKMNTVIEELELLAGIRTAKIELKPLNMARIIAEVAQRLAYLIEEYGAEITVSEYWPVAMGHTPWVEEVWANYISNALKYGGRPPKIQLGATERSDGMIRFWVRDNGPGLTPEERAHLFTEFTRLTQSRAGGYGLGLSIVRRIITKFGGEIGCESEAGEGSVFYFTLPSLAKYSDD
jgi:two-component system, sensor histidine kinase and response regulator